MGVLAARIAVLVFSASGKAPCGVVGHSIMEVMTDELEWFVTEIGLTIASDEMGVALSSCSCSCTSSSP